MVVLIEVLILLAFIELFLMVLNRILVNNPSILYDKSMISLLRLRHINGHLRSNSLAKNT